MTQEQKRQKWREYYHKTHPVKEPKTFFHPKMNRVVTRDHYATRIFWNRQMLDMLKRYFPVTLNEELAGMLGVSQRTMIRKARELGLSKNKEWLDKIWDERRMLAHSTSRRLGYPGSIKKGQHLSPATEFKKREMADATQNDGLQHENHGFEA